MGRGIERRRYANGKAILLPGNAALYSGITARTMERGILVLSSILRGTYVHRAANAETNSTFEESRVETFVTSPAGRSGITWTRAEATLIKFMIERNCRGNSTCSGPIKLSHLRGAAKARGGEAENGRLEM